MLLPPEHFGQLVELQPIEENVENSLSIKTSNPITFSAVGQWKPHETETETATEIENSKSTVLLEEVSNANQKNDSYTSICAHLEDLANHAKSDKVKLKGCKIGKEGLLIKEN